ncbi:hypothetical protein NUW58_g2019 [Xylaria curta]|uniref:Uncharacterized protein n=1 Tax=Xylaria curta TaxID=42375 RepID=A0ACC1PHK5_9PEZI|nr:hypothetical protein NUW58_g2019 [Xylaria curta]
MGAVRTNYASSGPFVVIAVLAVFLLFGILIGNGAFLAVVKNVLFGTFSNGSLRYRVYTGNIIIDTLLAQCVSFWTPVLTRSSSSLLLSTTLCASLQTLAIWATIEGLRNGETHRALRWAPLTIFVWQFVGTSIFVPLYAVVELRHHFVNSPNGYDASTPYAAARALIPAGIVALIHPFLTIHYPSSGTTESQMQTFIANYQLGGVLCYVLVTAGAYILSVDDKAAGHRSVNADQWWIQQAYIWFGVFSMTAHLDVVRQILTSTDDEVSFMSVFVPQAGLLGLPDAPATLYEREHLYFLQWDLVLLVLGVALWLSRTLAAIAEIRRPNSPLGSITRAALLIVLSLACMMLSPGAVGSAVFYYRENILRSKPKASKANTVK